MVTTAAVNKIDTSNFNFVQMEDQYMLAIAVRTDTANKYINFFSNEADLISYVDVSRVGFELPAVEIIFSFADRQLLPYLSEKSIFVVSIGKNLDTQIQSTFNIVTAQVNQKAEGKWTARIVGIYDRLSYVKTAKKQVYANYSSEIAKQLLQESLGKSVKTNVDVRSRDHMFWLRPNVSTYQFLYDLWLHSYIPDSIWLAAIDFEGQPRMTDLRKQAKIQPKVMLTTGTSKDSDNTYSILDNFDVMDNSSISNNFGGYAKTKQVYNLDEAKKDTLQKKEAPLLSNSDSFNRALNIETEAPYSLQNSNVYNNYHVAPMNNKSMLMSLKAFQLDVSAEGAFVPVELLDYVVMKDVQPDGQAQEDYSGIYMVGKIAHQIANKKIYTHITLWREAQNILAAPTPAAKAESATNKIANLESKVSTNQELLTPDTYQRTMKELQAAEKKILDFQKKVEDSISDSAVYKAYKDLDKKYREVKSQINNAYSMSMTIASMTPVMNEVTEKLGTISINTPLDEVRSTVQKYLNVQSYLNKLESEVSSKVSSNAVYSKYLEVRGEYNKMTSSIRTLQGMGIIGDLNEYIELDE